MANCVCLTLNLPAASARGTKTKKKHYNIYLSDALTWQWQSNEVIYFGDPPTNKWSIKVQVHCVGTRCCFLDLYVSMKEYICIMVAMVPVNQRTHSGPI